MLNRIYRHLACQAPIYLWLVVAMVAFGRHYAVTVNLSESLPGTLFLIQKGVHPAQGDLAAFLYNGVGPTREEPGSSNNLLAHLAER